MKCSLGDAPLTFMRPLLIRISPCLGNNSFQESEVAQLVITAHCKCLHKSILELQIHLPKGAELTLCILTVKAEHRPKQKRLVCVGGNLGQWYRITSHTLAGMCHTLKRVLNIRWDNRETFSQLAFCSALSAPPTLLWMPFQYFPFGKILSWLNLPLIQWSSCRWCLDLSARVLWEHCSPHSISFLPTPGLHLTRSNLGGIPHVCRDLWLQTLVENAGEFSLETVICKVQRVMT